MIHEESLLAVTGTLEVGAGIHDKTLRSPGMLLKHYAPKARLVVLPWRDESDFAQQLAQLRPSEPRDRIFVIAHTYIPMRSDVGGVSVIPHDAEAFARALYAELHRCDEAGAELIVFEALPSGPEWKAIADRLRRASAL
jgi:L-threonylcarbamoyladenylate synthase